MPDGHEVLMEFDDNKVLIVGDPQGILVKQLKSYTIHLLILYYVNIFLKLFFFYFLFEQLSFSRMVGSIEYSLSVCLWGMLQCLMAIRS